jgi:hypothetical protein
MRGGGDSPHTQVAMEEEASGAGVGQGGGADPRQGEDASRILRGDGEERAPADGDKRDSALRRPCSDRHLLDKAIDHWKAGRRVDGCTSQIVGVSRTGIIHSVKMRWKLVDTKVTESNIVVWMADVLLCNDSARDYDGGDSALN